MKKLAKPSVIFDFDGTLADTFNLFVDALEEATQRKVPMSDDEIMKLRGLSTEGVMKELGIKKWQLPLFIYRGKKAIARRSNLIQLFEGITDQVRQLHVNGYSLFIVSSNNYETISKVLKENQIADCFDDIVSGAGLFGKAKRLKKLIKKYSIIVERSAYVGDETRDIEAATSIGIKSIAVGWGYSTPESIKLKTPDGYADSPDVLGKVILSVIE